MKAFYREWGRCWLLITWGRYPEPLHPDEYAADDVPHPFGDPDALTGNITSPIGAQSGSFLDEVVQLNELEHAGKLSEAEVDAAIARAKNWVSQEDGS